MMPISDNDLLLMDDTVTVIDDSALLCFVLCDDANLWEIRRVQV